MDRKHDLDQKIKQALTSREQVPEELNRSLETQLFAKGSQRKISLWFLPAVANACLYSCFSEDSCRLPCCSGAAI